MPQLRRLLRAAALLCLVLMAAGAGVSASAQPHKRLAREQIDGLEAQWKQSMMTNDIPLMDRLLADDFLGVTVNGELVTKAQQLDRMRSRELTITSLETTDVKVKLLGQIAIVNALAQVEGMLDGKPLHGSFRYVRVYQRLPSGQWKITSFEVTRQHSRRGQNAQTGG